MPEEKKQLHPRAKWLFFFMAAPALLVAIGGFIGIFSAVISSDVSLPAEDFIAVVFIGLLTVVAGSLIAYIWAKLTYNYYKYEITPDAFRKEHGIIWKKYVSIPYGRIQNVDIYRGLIARLLGLSDVQIQTAGSSGSTGSYGAFSEGRLPGLSRSEAESLRDELIRRARGTNHSDGL